MPKITTIEKQRKQLESEGGFSVNLRFTKVDYELFLAMAETTHGEAITPTVVRSALKAHYMWNIKNAEKTTTHFPQPATNRAHVASAVEVEEEGSNDRTPVEHDKISGWMSAELEVDHEQEKVDDNAKLQDDDDGDSLVDFDSI